ncbi:MAG: hypothetical protein QM770_00580 [Tepidisphaeraceae bacterium]
MKTLAIALVAFLSAGCASRFAGEWVQDARIEPDGKVVELTGARMALRFDPPSTVLSGTYMDPAGVVANESVTINNFWTLKNETIAQFGMFSARVEDGKLLADVNGKEGATLRFVKHTGPSVFPPLVKLPAYSQSTASVPGPVAIK